jgi:hypothetical protein
LATLTIAAAGVKATAATRIVDPRGLSGEALIAGGPVYRSVAGLYFNGLNDTAAHANIQGVALNPTAGAGQPVRVGAGVITYTGTTTILAGHTYSLGNTGGAVVDDADVGSGKFKSVVAIGVDAATLNVVAAASGVAMP